MGVCFVVFFLFTFLQTFLLFEGLRDFGRAISPALSPLLPVMVNGMIKKVTCNYWEGYNKQGNFCRTRKLGGCNKRGEVKKIGKTDEIWPNSARI